MSKKTSIMIVPFEQWERHFHRIIGLDVDTTYYGAGYRSHHELIHEATRGRRGVGVMYQESIDDEGTKYVIGVIEQ